jgi:Zn-dependent alcohol dehydrogenase
MFTAKVEPNSTAVVFGLGGIGLNVIQGLRMIGARQIVGVDLNEDKKAIAEKFGMTHFVNPQELGKDLVDHLVELTGVRLWSAVIKAGERALSSASLALARKSAHDRFNWLPVVSGAAVLLVEHVDARTYPALSICTWMDEST